MSKQSPSQVDYKYISFECCLIGHIKDQIGSILDYGIVKFSKKLKPDNADILKQAIHLYFDRKLPGNLAFVFNEAFKNYVHNDNRGYDRSGKFNPEDELQVIISYFLEHPNPNAYEIFIAECRIFAQISMGLNALKLTHRSPISSIHQYNIINEIVENHQSKFGKDAEVMVKTDMIISFRDQDKKHHEFEIFKAFLAIKSIQGKNDFMGTNKSFICARMIGAKSLEIAKRLCRDKRLKVDFDRYNERYFFDKLLVELKVKEFITGKITYGRTIYLSTQLDNNLLSIAIMNHTERKVLSTAASLLKDEERLLRNKIANNLKNRNIT